MNKDLKWLAENAHEWRDGCCAIQKDDYGLYVFLDGSDPEQYVGVGEVCFTRAQWQAARDELSGKPSWDDAPEWASSLVQISEGQWFWCVGDQQPNRSGGWDSIDPKQSRAGRGVVLGDWRDTLERRPESHSVDATEKAWRGPEDGLPPVGTECEISNCGNLFTWCRVKYMGERLCVVDHKTHRDQHYHLSSVEFRPIRSEEDKVVDKMMKVMDAVAQAKMVVHEKQARALYQAGLRFKQENPE